MSAISPAIDESWKAALNKEFDADYFKKLKEFLVAEKSKYSVYPQGSAIFAAFNHTPFKKVKVVIIGQDPYHGEGQAHGLSFSVPDGVKQPPSLVNIFKEIKADLGIEPPHSGNLERWAKQGVLLLNATLTVRANTAGSHQKKGWELFTDAAIKALSEKRTGIIFLLWGNYAKQKTELIDKNKHFVLTAAHPSPLAGGAFFGCRHFSKTNALLLKQGIDKINW